MMISRQNLFLSYYKFCLIYYYQQISISNNQMLRRQNSEIISHNSAPQTPIHSHPVISHYVNLQELCYKKSLFNSNQDLLLAYAQRASITKVEVPLVDIVHISQKWYLLRTSKYSHNFFPKLNQGILGNSCQQLLNLFKSFVSLSQIYGFFRPTSAMIFMQKKIIKVWINEDIFENVCMMPLGKGAIGQKQFVMAFLAMIQSEMRQWQAVLNIFTIEQAFKMFEWRNRLNKASLTAIYASKEVIHIPNESKASSTFFEGEQMNNRLKGCKSTPFIENNSVNQSLPHQLSSSVTISNYLRLKDSKMSSDVKEFALTSSNQILKTSLQSYKPLKNSGEVRKTKKKFNLTSTSSTLQMFSEKFRATFGKKQNKRRESSQIRVNQHQSAPLFNSAKFLNRENEQKPISIEPVNIFTQLDNLFEDEKRNEIEFAVQKGGEQLQKIAQEMQQVLIW